MHKKKLSDSDLGWGGSHQTHIGLHENMLSGWSGTDKIYETYLFINSFERCIECTATINAIIRESGSVDAPKIKTGTISNDRNLLKLIRKNATEKCRYLTLGELPDGKLIAFLGEADQDPDDLIRTHPLISVPSSESLISNTMILLPKPFLLLAGISGTGKTRLVREQATASATQYGIENGDNYCLVPVRPDWHEPSDLLGYISRIGEGGARYVVTDLLCFIVKAWKHAVTTASAEGVVYKNLNSICPFWLCLDEMNLAPVEQYFADYLSILETRKWDSNDYSCSPILNAKVIEQLKGDGLDELWNDLKISGEENAGLRDYFQNNGIPLPLNLIVAGTVNMDETTHGFSRKVIDRALTIDFGEFFTNDYSQYYEADKKTAPRTLSFPRLSGVHEESTMAAVAADPDGRKTIVFLEKINTVLKDTPFQLAFRALNEILLSVVCFSPADEVHLQAVWDDFLMMKVLPRIEGDSEKLRYDGDGTGLLVQLSTLLKEELSEIAAARPDLLQEAPDGSEVEADCRSLKKLAWMQQRLENNSFTTFWP